MTQQESNENILCKFVFYSQLQLENLKLRLYTVYKIGNLWTSAAEDELYLVSKGSIGSFYSKIYGTCLKQLQP